MSNSIESLAKFLANSIFSCEKPENPTFFEKRITAAGDVIVFWANDWAESLITSDLCSNIKSAISISVSVSIGLASFILIIQLIISLPIFFSITFYYQKK